MWSRPSPSIPHAQNGCPFSSRVTSEKSTVCIRITTIKSLWDELDLAHNFRILSCEVNLFSLYFQSVSFSTKTPSLGNDINPHFHGYSYNLLCFLADSTQDVAIRDSERIRADGTLCCRIFSGTAHTRDGRWLAPAHRLLVAAARHGGGSLKL